MSSSRFSHFNTAMFSGSTNGETSSDAEINKHLDNGAMIITSGVCYRSRKSSAQTPKITGSFVSVLADQQGNIGDPITTIVKPDARSGSNNHNVPLYMMPILAQRNDHVGQVTIQTENETKTTQFQMQNQSPVCCYGLPEPSIKLSVINEYIPYHERFESHSNASSQHNCIIL